MIRVAIADDSAFTCRLLTAYVEDSGDCEVVAVALVDPDRLMLSAAASVHAAARVA